MLARNGNHPPPMLVDTGQSTESHLTMVLVLFSLCLGAALALSLFRLNLIARP